jgi:UDP-N-acetylglucosamine--N-acetylmuramyl-(pentapeptide) pyrophosphoryl-undecaprenol N-acetylglucosamine transferase
LRSIPVVLHEQNIVLGLANKVTKPLARNVCVSFQETLHQAGPRGVFTGNPVLPEIADLDRTAERVKAYDRFGLDPSRVTVLIFGGSLGARTINLAAVGLANRWEHRSDLQILHISGRSAGTQVDGIEAPSNYRRIEYTKEMATVYAVADVGICRGGATTVAELGAVGLPAVIVPYPHHRDQQQSRHAAVLSSAGAAVVVPDAEATASRLGTEIERLLDGRMLPAMAEAAGRLGMPDAAQRLAAIVRNAA